MRVNGYPIYGNTVCRGHPGFSDKVPVQLDPGRNLIAIYTFENGGGFNMCARFERNGAAIALETSIDPGDYEGREHEGVFCVRRAGERLYRLRSH